MRQRLRHPILEIRPIFQATFESFPVAQALEGLERALLRLRKAPAVGLFSLVAGLRGKLQGAAHVAVPRLPLVP